MTIGRVIEQLTVEGLLAAGFEAEIEVALANNLSQVEEGTPWYIRVLVGLTAWIAALFLLFFVVNLLSDGDLSTLISGLLLCAVAIGLRRQPSKSAFLGQLALVISLAGQFLFMMGVENLSHNITVIAMAIIILEMVLIGLYRDLLHRFLSTLVIIGAVVALLWEFELQETIHGLITLLAAGTLWLWMREGQWITQKLEPFSRPIGFGLIFGLLGLLALALLGDPEVKHWWLSGLGLWIVLLVQVYSIVRYYDIAPFSSFAMGLFAGTLLLLIPGLLTPGILGALIVLLLGFQRGNRLLIGLAVLFLTVFVMNFYYELEMTLLLKSFVLMGTGLIIFGLRYALLRQFRHEKELI